jgi:hypothetical protein
MRWSLQTKNIKFSLQSNKKSFSQKEKLFLFEIGSFINCYLPVKPNTTVIFM